MGLARAEVWRTRLDGFDERLGHTFPVTAFFAEGSYAIASRLSIALDVGSEIALGKTTLAINRTEAADLPRAAFVAALGLRFTL
jgi:hypothetical protein